jgi:hypothetical protein
MVISRDMASGSDRIADDASSTEMLTTADTTFLCSFSSMV